MRIAVLLWLVACGKPPCARDTTPTGVITTCHDGSFRRELGTQILERGTRIDGVFDGNYFLRYANGAQHLRGRYVHGRREGAWRSWHENGKVWVDATYVGGVPHGLWTETDASGAKLFEGIYDHGLLEGPWKTWHPDGKLRAEGTSHAGKLDGKLTEYLASGEREERSYKANRLHGPLIDYDATGKVTQTTEFVDGIEQKPEGK